MPKFAQIELFLDGTYSDVEQKDFIFKSRCICNYLERGLAIHNFETTFSRVNIKCTKEKRESEVRPMKGAPYLEVIINYEVPSLYNLDSKSIQSTYTQILKLGLKTAQGFMPVPFGYCIAKLAEFEKGGFQNIWVYTEKTWKKYSCRCVIEAELTVDKFTLQQLIYRADELLIKLQIAETKPREMLFYPFLGKLKLDAEGCILYIGKDALITKYCFGQNKLIKNANEGNDGSTH